VIDVDLYYRWGFPLPYLKPQDPALIWYLDVKSTIVIIILLYVLSKDVTLAHFMLKILHGSQLAKTYSRFQMVSWMGKDSSRVQRSCQTGRYVR
jgi:hypothetical protein